MEKKSVSFLRSKTNKEKLQHIYKICQNAMKDKKKLLIVVPNMQSAHFIDQFLWNYTPESFIPHVVSDMPTHEWIAITLQTKANINHAPRLLNLSREGVIFEDIDEIFEIFDQSSEEKNAAGQLKMNFYRLSLFEVKEID